MGTLRDVIAESTILLSSLISESVFNHIVGCTNGKEPWEIINEDHGVTKDVHEKSSHILIEKLSSFKKQEHRSANDMLLYLNNLVNGIKVLGVKQSQGSL